MKFKLTLSVNKNAFGNLLPFSYSYELSSWIYKVLASSDLEYATWLHNNGFSLTSKRFKFFSFSRLFFSDARPMKKTDRLAIYSDQAIFFLSFLPEKTTEDFIKGIFLENEFTIGDRKSKVQFRVKGVELLPSPNFGLKIPTFETLSPIIVSKKDDLGKIKYISPEDPSVNYGDSLLKNLLEKYRAYYQKDFPGSRDFSFELKSKAYSRLITIKSGTEAETRIRGFDFRFKFNADIELLKLMCESGAGEKNSVGFGMVETID